MTRFRHDASNAELHGYRAAVIRSTACPFCFADKNQLCTYYNDPSGIDRSVLIDLPYVHDDRSAVYHHQQMTEMKSG